MTANTPDCSSQEQNKFNIQFITTENGLPSDGIKGLQWDEKTGFLWIATELGLVRYNGYTALIFNKENTPYLKSEKFFPLFKDLKGDIFVVNKGNIFQVFANKLKSSILNNDPGNTPGRLQAYVSQKIPLNAKIAVNDYYDRFIPVDTDKCIIQSHDTLWSYHGGDTLKTYLTPLTQNYPVFATEHNVFSYDGMEQFSIYDASAHQFKKIETACINAAEQNLPPGKKNLYWESSMRYPIILAGGNAWILAYKNGKIVPKLICSEIPRNSSIKYAQYWEQGNILFLGTASKGILVLRKNYLKNIKTNQPDLDEPNAIYSQILLSNGNVLANTGHVLGPAGTPTKYLPVHGPFHNNTFITKDSILWYTNNDSLYHYDYKTHTRTYASHIPGSLYLAFAATENKLYVANNSNIYQIKNDKLISLSGIWGLGDPFDMVEIRPGILALATSNGLYRFNLATRKLDTVINKIAPVRTLWKYKSYIFIGTYGDGIYMWKDGILKKIPLDNNNYLRYTHCFILDTNGYCWMSTNRGLLKAALADILSAFEHDNLYIYYHFFGTNEGMNITEMNGGCTPCGIKLQNNDISFPTMDGALWVNPSMPVRLPGGSIFIDQITINGKKTAIDTSDSFFLDANTHDISFSVGFSAWCDKENVYLHYRLNPQTTQWIKIDAQHPIIHLSNLSYGKYELFIRALNGFGPGNYTIKKIRFEIVTPWYLRWWGIALLLSAFASILVLISAMANGRSLKKQRRLKNLLDKKTKEILTQNEKLEKNDRIKTRLISIISHDIVTPLKYLHLTSKYLSDRKMSLPENIRHETLEEVVNTARELELLSTNILNWIKYQNEERRIVKEQIDLHEIVEQVFKILKSLANKNNIELVNNIPINTMIIQFTDPVRIILYNLTANAINFTRQGSITINYKYIIEEIQIEVEDTGMGMSLSQIKNITSDHTIISSANVNKKSGHGLGYLIIKDLLKMVGGRFYIQSRQGAGTVVFIIFPFQ